MEGYRRTLRVGVGPQGTRVKVGPGRMQRKVEREGRQMEEGSRRESSSNSVRDTILGRNMGRPEGPGAGRAKTTGDAGEEDNM